MNKLDRLKELGELYKSGIISIKEMKCLTVENKLSLEDYGINQYICPICLKPVFPRGINSDSVSPHFSHYEKGIFDPDCPKRPIDLFLSTCNEIPFN